MSFTLGRAAPTIPVSDIDRALAFYVGVLGLQETFRNGQPTSFVIVERGATELHLALEPGYRGGEQNVAHLMVEGPDALHEHLVAHGVPIVGELRDADYGMRTFVMADPDGNRIDVGADL